MDDYSTPSKRSPMLRGAAVAAIAAVVGGIVALSRRSETPVTADSASPAASASPLAAAQSPSAPAAAGYKDGTYDATGTYQSPGGQQSIGVKLTLAGDVITDATVTSNTADRESKEYQDDFIGGYKQYVVGKSVDSVSLSYVSGSSLTSQGFNKALADIKAQAKS